VGLDVPSVVEAVRSMIESKGKKSISPATVHTLPV
jgi:hypothetical protein